MELLEREAAKHVLVGKTIKKPAVMAVTPIKVEAPP
jgi:hypothetical protein